MPETVTGPGVTGNLLYAEDRSGVERRYVVYAITAPAIFLLLSVPYLLVNSNGLAVLLLIPWAIAAIWTIFSVLSLIFLWPIGIRIDSAGIRIGGLRAWEKRHLSGRWPPRKPFHVGAQGRAVFTCPWDGVKALYLVCSREELRPLNRQKNAFRRRTSQLRTPLGYLYAGTAGLVIVTDPARTSSDPGTFRANWSQRGNIKGVMSPTWLVPTRQPEALRAALAKAANAPTVHDHLPTAEKFAFFYPANDRKL